MKTIPFLIYFIGIYNCIISDTNNTVIVDQGTVNIIQHFIIYDTNWFQIG